VSHSSRTQRRMGAFAPMHRTRAASSKERVAQDRAAYSGDVGR
jgi:hypothetical protein